LRFQVLRAVELAVPLCAACAQRVKRRKWLVGLVPFALTFGIALGVLLILVSDEVVFWTFFGASAIVALGVAAMIAHRATTPASIRVADAARGILRVSFRNPDYARYLITHGHLAR
jgi:hypothetical protein